MKVDIKTKAEIARMREACRMSAEIRDICASAVAPGVTTGEIDDLVVAYCERHKVKASFYKYAGFPGHICVSINDEVIHGIPSRNRVIMPGDLVKTDVGIFKDGFHGDTSRTVALCVSDPEVLRLVDVTRKCLAAGIAAAGPGVHLGDVGYAIQKVAEDAGFGVVRDWIGHGGSRSAELRHPRHQAGASPRNDYRHRADDNDDEEGRKDVRRRRQLDRVHAGQLPERPL